MANRTLLTFSWCAPATPDTQTFPLPLLPAWCIAPHIPPWNAKWEWWMPRRQSLSWWPSTSAGTRFIYLYKILIPDNFLRSAVWWEVYPKFDLSANWHIKKIPTYSECFANFFHIPDELAKQQRKHEWNSLTHLTKLWENAATIYWISSLSLGQHVHPARGLIHEHELRVAQEGDGRAQLALCPPAQVAAPHVGVRVETKVGQGLGDGLKWKRQGKQSFK